MNDKQLFTVVSGTLIITLVIAVCLMLANAQLKEPSPEHVVKLYFNSGNQRNIEHVRFIDVSCQVLTITTNDEVQYYAIESLSNWSVNK